MFPRLLPALALLCACASPSPQFFNASRQDVVIDGRSFTVFRKDNRVQVIRHGYARSAERPDIPAQMLRAAAQATGCTPIETSFQGDSGERRGRIRC
jgi:hypothetical protein